MIETAPMGWEDPNMESLSFDRQRNFIKFKFYERPSWIFDLTGKGEALILLYDKRHKKFTFIKFQEQIDG